MYERVFFFGNLTFFLNMWALFFSILEPSLLFFLVMFRKGMTVSASSLAGA